MDRNPTLALHNKIRDMLEAYYAETGVCVRVIDIEWKTSVQNLTTIVHEIATNTTTRDYYG